MKYISNRLMAMAAVIGTAGLVSQAALQFDFGSAGLEPGFTAVGSTTLYSAGPGYGWLSTSGLNLRDRRVPDVLRTDFVFNNTSAGNVFRVSGLEPNGKYLMKVICGDADYGDHIITVSVPGAGTLPTLSPYASEYLELSATVDADASGILNITFGSPTPNWVVNALTLESTTNDITPIVEGSYVNEWDPAVFATNPATNLLAGFDGSGAVDFTDTGLSRADYLALIESEIEFWKTKQNSNGAIIDPYRGSETQYSTPAFANAAAALVVYAGRTDLLEPAAKAMDWASYRLSINAAADGHDDFYPGMLANTYRLIGPLVNASREAIWASNLGYNPFVIYDYAPGSFNWTVVSSCGDALLQLLGIRPADNPYVSVCWSAQGRHFTSPYGLYEEGPMAYDHFPRIWFEDALAQGYNGPFSTEVAEAMDRAAIASLFMQSPMGELPAGGRSSHHQWNEAEQCVTFEIYAAKAKVDGDFVLAAAYKRAAHLSLSSMFRWVNSDGAMQVVKNWVDPESRHGYESYSYYSQYNLLPMAMLAIAYEHAADSEDVLEGPAPADTGGFMFQLDGLHKVFANAGGTYVEIDTAADHKYDATGLIRVHQKGVSPQLGPSDSLLAAPGYRSPDPSPTITGVGVSWYTGGAWRTLGTRGDDITSVVVTPIEQSTTQVVFEVTYSGATMPGVTNITEQYTITPSGVQLTTELEGYSGPLRYLWPVLSNDGKTASTIAVDAKTVSVSQGGAAVTFTASGADSVRVEGDEYSSHNGWARLGVAEFPAGGAITLLISKEESDVNILSASPTGEVSGSTPTLEVVIEDVNITVDPNRVVLLLDANPVTADSISKIGTTTTVSYVCALLTFGLHTAGVVAGPSSKTNEWTFSIAPPPAPPITYVDAVWSAGGNTTLTNGNTVPTTTSPSGTDNSWRSRGYGNSATILESAGDTGGGTSQNEDCPRLMTTISDLMAGSRYDIYAYFWSDPANWSLLASLTNEVGDLPIYTRSIAAAAVKAAFVSAPVVTESNRIMYQAPLGSAIADEAGEIKVYIDDDPASGGDESRNWYDGVGYRIQLSTTPTDIAVAVGNDSVNVAWPESHTGWMLQSRPNLSNDWSDVGGSTTGNWWNIPIVNVQDSEFFRIRYPLP